MSRAGRELRGAKVRETQLEVPQQVAVEQADAGLQQEMRALD